MPDRWTGAVTDHTAVSVRVALNTGFHAARARLKILTEGGMLPRASEVAYGEGITGLAELAGPGGMKAGIERNAYADGSVVGHGTSPPVGHQPGSGPKVPFRAGRRSAALWPKYPAPDGRSKRSCPERPRIAVDGQRSPQTSSTRPPTSRPRPWPASPQRQGRRCDRCSRFALSGAGAVAAFGPRGQVLRV